MPFVPTQNQIDSLYMLLTQLRRENIEIRLIRFVNWAGNLKDCELEVLPLEEEDRYIIYFDGKITPRYK